MTAMGCIGSGRLESLAAGRQSNTRQAPASISGRGSWQPPLPARRKSVPLQQCRVAENEDPVTRPRNPYEPETEVLSLGPRHAKQGPAGKQVEKTFVEAMFDEEVNVEDTNYWFSAPEGGWDTEEELVWYLEEEDPEPTTAANFGPGRTELADLKEGTVMTGEVVCLMYYHGVQVDLGAQYDGLVPVLRNQWANEHFQEKFGVSSGVAGDFEIGQMVTVKIHKINTRARCRWPIQLEILEPDVQHKLTPPDEYSVPFDLRGVKSYEEAFRITGRPRPEQLPRPTWIPQEEMEAAKAEMGSPLVSAVAGSPVSDVQFAGRSMMQDVFLEIERLNRLDLEQQAAAQAEVTEDEEIYEEDYSSV